MIGILFATEMEAKPFLDRGAPEGTVTVISGMGMEAARIATEKLIKEHGCTSVINAGVCGALNNRLERGGVYRVSMVSTEKLKAAVNVGMGVGLKKLITVEEPVFEKERKRELSKQADLVDMEGYAVARVCEEHSVPCILVKGVTDFGDHNGKEDIQKHIDPVSQTVAEAVLGIVDAVSSRVAKNKRSQADATRLEASSTLMQKLHSFTKVEHTIFSLPLLFAGAWLGAGGMPSIRSLLLIALVGLGARTFGMAVNRILDKNIDAKNPRTQNRELPSGKLSLGQGYAVAFAGIILYFVGCALPGDLVLKLSWAPLPGGGVGGQVFLGLRGVLSRYPPGSSALRHCVTTASASAWQRHRSELMWR